VTIEAPNGTVTIDERPERIVSISPTSTEVLFAVGAGSQVVAVDSLSNHPPEAPVTDLSAFTPSVESIAAFDPDLVVLSFDPNGEVIPGLDALGIPVILHPTAANLSDAYAQWEQIGAATGHLADAVALVATTDAAIMDAYGSVPESSGAISYYYEIDPTFYSSTSSTFIGEVLAGTGMVNIADPADEDGFGFPQLTAEFIVGEDPDFIILADTSCCGQSASTVAERPGWDTMTAVREGQIIELDDDVASRWSPRIIQLVEAVVAPLIERAMVDA
jgi:iron complex transport system substrate-binding protein